MNHSLYQDEILKALPFKRLPCTLTRPVEWLWDWEWIHISPT
jgi:hypothetical protein